MTFRDVLKTSKTPPSDNEISKLQKHFPEINFEGELSKEDEKYMKKFVLEMDDMTLLQWEQTTDKVLSDLAIQRSRN